jgi:hypothetical protein
MWISQFFIKVLIVAIFPMLSEAKLECVLPDGTASVADARFELRLMQISLTMAEAAGVGENEAALSMTC